MSLFRKKREEAPLEPASPGEGQALPIDREELVVRRRPRSHIAEQYRQLRNSIQALNQERASRTVVFTSSVRGEGKSVAILNLALAMVELPRVRVVVVDADLKAPTMEGYLGLPRRKGLTDLLRGEIPMDQAVRATSVERLDVMGAGSLPDNPSEVMNIDRIRQVLNSLKQRYDYVLIDTPPALAMNHASILGSLADGVILVIRLGGTPKHLVEETYHQLESLGGNVIGTCLTGANIKEQLYQY